MKENPISRGILNPQTIALVGVSSDPNKNTGRPLRFLKSHGFSGEVVPINPNRREVQGISAYPCLQDAPNQIDHAFIMVPSHQILSVIADCIAAKVPLATIYSDGFAEQGRNGAELQAEMVHLARKGNLRLIGPNSMGVIDTRAGLTLTISAFLEQSELKPGRIGVI